MLTIPHHGFTPYLPKQVCWIKGQLEIGTGGTNFLHWQIIVLFRRKQSLCAVRECFGPFHAGVVIYEEAATDYVWKEESSVPGTRFELGERPFRRNSSEDWERIWHYATLNDLLSIPAGIRIQHYRTLQSIAGDYAEPVDFIRESKCYWGATGTGKSRIGRERAIAAGVRAYPKDPKSKFWYGYRGQEYVVIDEFEGGIDISHILRWTDRYAVCVEIKNSSRILSARVFYFSSNIPPERWWPHASPEQYAAFERRVEIIHVTENLFPE